MLVQWLVIFSPDNTIQTLNNWALTISEFVVTCWSYKLMFIIWDGVPVVVRALASHQCDPGFDSRTRSFMLVEFVVGSLLCSERFFSRYSGFPLSLKRQHFQFDLERSHVCYMSLWLGRLGNHSWAAELKCWFDMWKWFFSADDWSSWLTWASRFWTLSAAHKWNEVLRYSWLHWMFNRDPYAMPVRGTSNSR